MERLARCHLPCLQPHLPPVCNLTCKIRQAAASWQLGPLPSSPGGSSQLPGPQGMATAHDSRDHARRQRPPPLASTSSRPTATSLPQDASVQGQRSTPGRPTSEHPPCKHRGSLRPPAPNAPGGAHPPQPFFRLSFTHPEGPEPGCTHQGSSRKLCISLSPTGGRVR